MSTIMLVRALAGFGNPSQEMVMRTHSLNINPSDVDALFLNKMGGAPMVDPVTLHEVAVRSGGISTNPDGNAYIEGSWGIRRGICKLEFVTQDNAYMEEKLVILGYMYGGSVSIDGGIMPDTFFVPDKMWCIQKQTVGDHNGLPTIKSAVTNAGTFQLDIPPSYSPSGARTLRPVDILGSCASYQYQSDNDMDINDGFVPMGNSESVLRAVGINLSKTDNLSTTKFAEKLINSSMNVNHSVVNNVSGMEAISSASNTHYIKELSVYDNPFVIHMRQSLGQASMGGFQGWTFGELQMAFNNIGDVININLLDDDRFPQHDNRIDSKEMGGGTYQELIATELSNVLIQLLIDNRLQYLEFSANNDLSPNEIQVNGSGVSFVHGAFMPLMDEDVSAPYNVETFKEQFISSFYGKYNGDYAHNKVLVTIKVEAFVFGEIIIEICLNGDYTNGRRFVYPSFADVRKNLTLTTNETAQATMGNFYVNLQNHFNLSDGNR